MFVTAINISREGYYGSYGEPDMTKPFRCTVTVHGDSGKIELKLPPEASERVVALIAEEIAEAGRRTAEALVAKCLEVSAAPMLIKGE